MFCPSCVRGLERAESFRFDRRWHVPAIVPPVAIRRGRVAGTGETLAFPFDEVCAADESRASAEAATSAPSVASLLFVLPFQTCYLGL